MSSEDFPHEAPQSGHGGGRGICTSASCRDQDDRGETGFRDRPATVDGRSSKKHAA